MTSHGQRGLQLLYNFINLPSVMSGTLGAVTYSFSADGTKVAVEDNSGNGYHYMGSLIIQTMNINIIKHLNNANQ